MSQKKFLQTQRFNHSMQLFGLNIAIGLYFLLSFIIFVFLFGHVVALERSRWPFYNDEIDELIGVSVAGVINVDNISEESINRNCLQYEFTNRTTQGIAETELTIHSKPFSFGTAISCIIRPSYYMVYSQHMICYEPYHMTWTETNP